MKIRSGVILLLLFGACATPRTLQPFDEHVVLRLGGTAELPDGFGITFSRLVSDSRCPRNVACIQRGEAVVELTCSYEKQSKLIRLSTDEKANRAEVSGDGVELLRVEPFPIVPSPPASEYSVTIRVTRPGRD
ncbi:MAG: hypothetical protein ACXVJO_13090 [Thermoanaerobaculia bacterium]